MVGPEMVGYGTVRYGQGDKFGRTPVLKWNGRWEIPNGSGYFATRAYVAVDKRTITVDEVMVTVDELTVGGR